MKKLVLIAILSAAATLGYSQGTVNFQNRITGQVDAPISYAPGGSKPEGKIDGATTGATAMVGLFAGPDGATEDQLVLIAPAVNFRGGTAAGYVNVGSAGSRTVNGVAPGAFAMVQVRAWDTGTAGATWESALASGAAYKGKSNILRIATGGAGSPPGPAANLVGLQAFSIVVPEPGTIAMAILGGAGALFLMRRRK